MAKKSVPLLYYNLYLPNFKYSLMKPYTVGFIVPIKPKNLSSDWVKDSKLLARTLKSICNQTYQNYIIYVIHNEKPIIEYDHPSIKYIYFPHERLNVNQIEDYHSYGKTYYKEKFAENIMDKIRKLNWGLKKALIDNCQYIMAIDSDDLVSNKIVEFIETNSKNNSHPGWYIDKGYVMIDGKRNLVKQTHLEDLNGSTHIIRHDLVPNPDISSKKMLDFSLFESHGYIKHKLKIEKNETIESLPLCGIIYVCHENNWSEITNIASKKNIKTLIKKILRYKYLSKKLKNDFGIE